MMIYYTCVCVRATCLYCLLEDPGLIVGSA